MAKPKIKSELNLELFSCTRKSESELERLAHSFYSFLELELLSRLERSKLQRSNWSWLKIAANFLSLNPALEDLVGAL